MLQTDLQKLIEKSKEKSDGIYSMKPYKYVVKNKSLVLVGNIWNGEVSQFCFGFLSKLGRVERHKLDNELKRLLQQI